MKAWSDFTRKYYFFIYNTRPFRFSLFTTHLKKRLLSTLSLKKGFRVIDLALTYECNLRCKHCSAVVMEQKNRKTLTLDDYARIVQQAGQLDNLSWNITGGEPLLVPWLDELIPLLEPRTHYISIQTNGMILSPKRARELRRLGVNCITTSVDSIDPVEHNTFRGNPLAFQKVFEGIKNAQQAGMQVLVGGTVTHQNVRSEGLRRLIEAVNEHGALFIYMLAMPCGKWQGNEDVLLRGDDRDYLDGLLAKYPMSTTDHEVGRNAIGCPAGTEKLYITPYGDVLPCPFIHVSFGNVQERSLPDIVASMQRIPYFAQYQKTCVAAEDHEFRKQVLSKLDATKDSLPVDAKRVFEAPDQS